MSASGRVGDLSEWSEQVLTGSALSAAVTAVGAGIPPKSDNWVMRQSVTGSAGPNDKAPAEGPHAGQSGKRTYSSTRTVPIQEGVFFEVMITPRSDFTGAVKIWMNGELLFEQTNVKTGFPEVGAGGAIWFHNLAYGGNITPTPFHHYVDDVTISLGRLPYTP